VTKWLIFPNPVTNGAVHPRWFSLWKEAITKLTLCKRWMEHKEHCYINPLCVLQNGAKGHLLDWSNIKQWKIKPVCSLSHCRVMLVWRLQAGRQSKIPFNNFFLKFCSNLTVEGVIHNRRDCKLAGIYYLVPLSKSASVVSNFHRLVTNIIDNRAYGNIGSIIYANINTLYHFNDGHPSD